MGSHLKGLRADVQAGYGCCASCQSVYGKASGVCEDVKNGFLFRQFSNAFPVVPVVEEIAGFMALYHISGKQQPVFPKYDFLLFQCAVNDLAVRQSVAKISAQTE